MHDSDNRSATSGGEHSSDEDTLKYKGSSVDDKKEESSFHTAKHHSSLENSYDRSYESENSVIHETNVDDKDQIDERKSAATVNRLFTKRRETLERKDCCECTQRGGHTFP